MGPQTGIARYTQQLIIQLKQLEQDLSFYYSHHWHRQTPVQNIQNSTHFFPALTRLIPEKLHFPLKSIRYRQAQKTFIRHLEELRPAVIHFPDFFAYPCDPPSIITIHDISCLKHPEFHPYSRAKWHEKMLPLSISNAQHIVTVSQFSKSEIINHLNVPGCKVSVTYNGVSSCFAPLRKAEVEPILNRHSLKYNHYFLYVGTLEPRKNLKTILRAFERLPKSLRFHFPLVLSGLKGWKVSKLLSRYEQYIKQGQIRILGFVPTDELPALYGGATLFLYPSLYEGFGLPPLEAMSCGTVPLVSNRTSLPEVVGRAGFLLDAEDDAVWSQQIQELVEDHALRKQSAEACIKQAREFSWKKCALETLKIYNYF